MEVDSGHLDDYISWVPVFIKFNYALILFIYIYFIRFYTLLYAHDVYFFSVVPGLTTL